MLKPEVCFAVGPGNGNIMAVSMLQAGGDLGMDKQSEIHMHSQCRLGVDQVFHNLILETLG